MIQNREPRSVRASEKGKRLLKRAKRRMAKETGEKWTYETIAAKLYFSQDVVKDFFNCINVYTDNAKSIVEILGLEFSEIVDILELNPEIEYNIKTQKIQNSKTPSQKLKEALFDLNYIDQEYHFRRSLGQMGTVGAFLIHGEKGYGQRWLVNRLAGLIPYNSTAYQKPLNIQKKTLLDFWENMGGSIGCDPNPEAIAEQLYQQWTTQTVILSITDIHKVDQGLESFLEQVWLRVIDKINNHNPSKNPFKMILFIVGNKTFNSPSNLLIDLTPIQDFKEEVIRIWGGAQLPNLLYNYSTEQIEGCIEDIIQQNSLPIFTLEQICESCSINYYSDIERSFTL
jgi:hypothetical protein